MGGDKYSGTGQEDSGMEGTGESGTVGCRGGEWDEQHM
jgi:hypothetical protein